jgi:flagellar basal-body rod modification protein FlgD
MATGISGTGTASTIQTTKQPDSLTKGAGGALGKDQFLQLLVAQMKNQDPSNPMDGSQMAAQLAQFSSVEQLTQINETLATQNTGQTGLATLLANNGALGSVGKTVLVGANAVDTSKGAPSTVMADIPSTAKSAVLKVYDENGTEVASQDLGSVSAGRKSIDLTKSTQSSVGAGTFKYVVEADTGETDPVAVPTYVAGKIDSVRFSSNGPMVSIGGVQVPYMSVTEITG